MHVTSRDKQKYLKFSRNIGKVDDLKLFRKIIQYFIASRIPCMILFSDFMYVTIDNIVYVTYGVMSFPPLLAQKCVSQCAQIATD